MTEPASRPKRPFRLRLTLGFIYAAVLPVAAFGLFVLVQVAPEKGSTFGAVLLFAIAAAVIIGVVLALYLAADVTAPLRRIATSVERVSRGDLSTRIDVDGEDELGRLAESHNRLAADLERRNRELRRILSAIEKASPSLGVDALADMAGEEVRAAFEMIDAVCLLVDPREIPTEDHVPGEPRPIRALLRIGDETLGLVVGRLPATRSWEPADQDLVELYAAEIAVAVRNAQLFQRIEAQNSRLVELDAAKDEFLRGVSHNLQTPLTSIRAYADQLDADRPDRRLSIIGEQSDRLSRMVRQLLTVSRLESGALRPRVEVLALAPRVRRTWEALGQGSAPFELVDQSEGWLAVADPDQLDQVLWALLDNAVKYGAGSTVAVTIAPEAAEGAVALTVADRGPGIAAADVDRLFARFERGAAEGTSQGTGLGLYVSRELCRAMGGDLVLAGSRPADATDPTAPADGAVRADGTVPAAFRITLPGEPPEA
ncbi:MAG TPA: ATP-binding protein [Candidatus Limnocylindrales bacterium]|nr:ATP-binding protein [Candidatus Limnocylindrales bacterium]